jgi:hypothetical protein
MLSELGNQLHFFLSKPNYQFWSAWNRNESGDEGSKEQVVACNRLQQALGICGGQFLLNTGEERTREILLSPAH